ncbi:MAG: peptidase T, partial [Erysipelotrichaceae bacterium]|nr:peptidase T [Erysipelotrichaceae bacterium]
MDIIKRFLSYVSIDTTSQESESCPSTHNQLLLAHQLEEELKELGAVDVTVDENGFVYGTVKGNVEGDYSKVGYLAHMDTSDATSGSNIKARVIENYDGKDIILSEGIKTTLKEYPQIARHTGKTIIVTDGKTLLGGDDKAGIAIIMEMVAYYAKHPEERHAEFRVCFTPDEETGGGISHINKELLNCDYAYTL